MRSPQAESARIATATNKVRDCIIPPESVRRRPVSGPSLACSPRTRTEPVFLDLLDQCRTRYAESFGGPGPVVPVGPQRPLDVDALDVGHRPRDVLEIAAKRVPDLCGQMLPEDPRS